METADRKHESAGSASADAVRQATRGPGWSLFLFHCLGKATILPGNSSGLLLMSLERAAGILLHPTSLPSLGGIGDFGPAAYEFVDFLASARIGVWQVLPLGPLGYGNSPYSATSAFAGNPLLISLERLAEKGWIAPSELSGLSTASGAVEYD